MPLRLQKAILVRSNYIPPTFNPPWWRHDVIPPQNATLIPSAHIAVSLIPRLSSGGPGYETIPSNSELSCAGSVQISSIALAIGLHSWCMQNRFMHCNIIDEYKKIQCSYSEVAQVVPKQVPVHSCYFNHCYHYWEFSFTILFLVPFCVQEIDELLGQNLTQEDEDAIAEELESILVVRQTLHRHMTCIRTYKLAACQRAGLTVSITK